MLPRIQVLSSLVPSYKPLAPSHSFLASSSVMSVPIHCCDLRPLLIVSGVIAAYALDGELVCLRGDASALPLPLPRGIRLCRETVGVTGDSARPIRAAMAGASRAMTTVSFGSTVMGSGESASGVSGDDDPSTG